MLLKNNNDAKNLFTFAIQKLSNLFSFASFIFQLCPLLFVKDDENIEL